MWDKPLDPGKYAINNQTTKIQVVPTTNLVLNWANARSEAHNLDKNLNTITVRSKDGFTFNLDVSQIIHIPAGEAPKVIARFGSIQNLVSQVLEPTIGNYFRNSAQDSDVIDFLGSRKQRQDAAKARISEVLEEYNVHAVDTLIGDIVPPADLMKTLTDRKIAQENEKTYETQKAAEVNRQSYEKERAVADMQKQMVTSQQGVEIAQRTADAAVKKAEGDASAVKLNAGAQAEATKLTAAADAFKVEQIGRAEATKIAAIGDATAKAYQAQVDAMGADNFAKFKIIEEIANGHVRIIPEIQFNNGANGGGSNIDTILGLQVIELLKQGKLAQTNTQIISE